VVKEWEKGSIAMRGPRALVLGIVLTVAAVGQVVLTMLFYNESGNSLIRNIGWVILWISAIFGWAPIMTFRKWGGVPKGKSYINTTVLVDRGVYAIVRHPQYLAGMLISVALPLIAQHWLVGVLGVVALPIYYIDTYTEETAATAKFGEAYTQYAARVPRVNFFLGIIRWARRRAAGR
jgi:protein-S-isoprenylcysteine O-methyltransferase Ste14